MAKTVGEKSTYGAFERFLYIFLIPLVFTMILSGVLLTLFGYDVKNTALSIGHSIPLVGHFVPAPAKKAGSVGAGAGASASNGAKVEQLTRQLAQKDADLKKAADANAQKDDQIKQLQAQIDDLQKKLQEKTQTSAEYQQQIKELADIYAKMTPRKAAPILENLTMPELVLVLNAMDVTARASVLEAMTPKVAAEASIKMKDVVPVKDQEIAALQARLQLDAANADSQSGKLTNSDLAGTFAGMSAKNAAGMLLQMYSGDPGQVEAVLGAMPTASRAAVLSAMADSDPGTAAKIASKLGG